MLAETAKNPSANPKPLKISMPDFSLHRPSRTIVLFVHSTAAERLPTDPVHLRQQSVPLSRALFFEALSR
jgi:hypothetical protein